MNTQLYKSKIELEGLLCRLHSEAMKDNQNAYKWKKVKKINKKLNTVNRVIAARCSKSQCYFMGPKKTRFHIVENDAICDNQFHD